MRTYKRYRKSGSHLRSINCRKGSRPAPKQNSEVGKILHGSFNGISNSGPSQLMRMSQPGGELISKDNTAPSIVHNVVRSPGKPLDSSTRRHFEQQYGQDFSQVRVHTGEAASRSAQAVNAKAYTVSNHIVFNSQSAPSKAGENGQLLSHELAHVVQWGNRPIPANLKIAPSDSPAEHQARKGASHSQSPTNSLQRAAVVCDEYQAAETGSATPANGIRVSVNRVSKTANVTANLETHGAAADAAKTSTLRSSISNHWNGSFADGFRITTSVSAAYRRPGQAANSGASQIEIVNAGTDSPSVTNRSSSTIRLNLDYVSNSLTWTSAHEFGHLMGLRDRYSTAFWDRVAAFFGGERGASIPDTGYENNIMAVNGGSLESKNVRDLIARYIPYRCTRWRLENPL